jgi:prepilin-type N-terminal cleavage/methylation domain-containing protein
MRDPNGRQSVGVGAPSAGPGPRRHACGIRRRRWVAFSLIELVIVVMILSIIAAIALRRLSGYAGRSATNAARQDVSVLQLALERYRAEHGNYPLASQVVPQLTKFSDVFGATSDTRTPPYIYGPYVRQIPPVPLGPARGSTTIASAPGPDVGWIYDAARGEIKPNE